VSRENSAVRRRISALIWAGSELTSWLVARIGLQIKAQSPAHLLRLGINRGTGTLQEFADLLEVLSALKE
jgi:hypothetical protein